MSFTDNFNRTENLDVSSNWTRTGGASNDAVLNGISCLLSELSSTGTVFHCPDQGSADHYTQMKRTTTANAGCFECCVRLTDNANFIGYRINTGNVQVYKVDAGSFTALINVSVTHAADDEIELQAEGNTIRAYHKGVQVGSDVTESFNNTETAQGMISRLNFCRVDDFEAGAIGAVSSSIPPIYHHRQNQGMAG